MPSPDLVFYLKITPKCQHSRTDWGIERFESSDLQKKVAANYEKLKDDSWEVIDASQNEEKIHNTLLKRVIQIINENQNRPIGQLYE